MFNQYSNIITAIPGLFLLNKTQHYLANSCFSETYPNITFVNAILNNKMPGLVFVDHIKSPNFSIILAEEPFGFFSKNVDLDLIQHLCHILKNKTNTHFKFILDNSITNLSLKTLDTPIVQRLSYSLKPEKFLSLNTKALADQPYHSSVIDSILFEKCHLKERLYNMYLTKENYLKHALGACLIFENEILSEAHAIIANQNCELGVFTAQNFRNKGLSKMVCGFLIKQCLTQNFSIKWTCNADNLASAHLADNLGFELDYHYLSLALTFS